MPPGGCRSWPAPEPGLRVNPNPFTETRRNIGFARENRPVFLAILGISWFWLYGALFLAQFPAQPRQSEIPKTIAVLAGPSLATAPDPLLLQDKVTTKGHKLVNREIVVDHRASDEVYVHLSLYTT